MPPRYSTVRNKALSALLAVGPLLAGLLAAQTVATQQGKELTVERIYGQPSLSGTLTTGLQWSPDGKLVSYFHRSGEGREARTDLWVLEVASGQRRVLVGAEKLQTFLPPQPQAGGQQTGLGRFPAQRYFWAPGSSALLFVAQGNLYWFDLKAQTATALTRGTAPIEDPKISPDGAWASFVRNYDLWVVHVRSGKETQLTRGGREELMNGKLDWVYPEELDIRTAYWWSPDSRRIAYLQMDERPVTRYPIMDYLSYTGKTEFMRYPKAGGANPVVRVGVVSVRGGATRWMDTGRESDIYLPRVNWLPDSKSLAIQRLNRAQTRLEVLVANASTGRSHVLLTEEDRYWINLHHDLHFFADGRLLWSSERDGFRHLYLYDRKGKLLKQLTKGSWSMTDVAALDEKRGVVYFLATEKSPLERHLYRVSLDGTPTRITREEGTHSILLAPDAQHYVDTYSNVMTPPRQYVHRADGTRAFNINENRVAELATYNLQPVEFFTLRAADGTELYAFMIKPPGFDPRRKHPVLVHTYGGPHGQIVRNAWGGANLLWHQMMAQKGYIIFGLDNRGMTARGHAFETHIHRRMGEVELADQLTGVNYLRSLPYVDGSRIGIWGWSYGGYMTLYAMFNASEVFKAGFAGAPVTDWHQYDTIYTERYMGRPQDNPDGYKRSSPVNQAGQLKGKLLIAHGSSDDNVHFANSVQLAEELIRAGRHVELQIYPGRGHGISDPRARVHLFRRVTQFFLDHL